MTFIELLGKRLHRPQPEKPQFLSHYEAMLITCRKLKRVCPDIQLFEQIAKDGDVLYSIWFNKYPFKGKPIISNQVWMWKSNNRITFKGSDGIIDHLSRSKDPLKQFEDAIKRSENLLHIEDETLTKPRKIDFEVISGNDVQSN